MAFDNDCIRCSKDSRELQLARAARLLAVRMRPKQRQFSAASRPSQAAHNPMEPKQRAWALLSHCCCPPFATVQQPQQPQHYSCLHCLPTQQCCNRELARMLTRTTFNFARHGRRAVRTKQRLQKQKAKTLFQNNGGGIAGLEGAPKPSFHTSPVWFFRASPLLLRRVQGAFLTVGGGLLLLLLLLIVVRRCDSLMMGIAMGALSAVTLVLTVHAVRAVERLLPIHALLGAVSLRIREWHTHGHLHAHVTEHAAAAHRVHHVWVPEAVRTHLMVRHVLLRGGIRLLVARAARVVMHQSAVE